MIVLWRSAIWLGHQVPDVPFPTKGIPGHYGNRRSHSPVPESCAHLISIFIDITEYICCLLQMKSHVHKSKASKLRGRIYD